VEQWYNQGHGAVLSRHTDNRFPYWVYARSRKAVPCDAEPQRLWRNYFSRLASQSDFRVWPTSRSIRSILIFWYGDWAPRARKQDIGEYAKGYAGADSPRANSLYADATGGFFAARPHTLSFAANVLFKTTDAGNSWQVISPI